MSPGAASQGLDEATNHAAGESPPEAAGASPGAGPRRSGAVLLLIAAAFLAARLPVMLHQPGGQDEDIYAVPGLTILQSCLPQLPHVPARNAESVFYRADECVFCEPPLYFYYQAAFFAVLPKTYGTARIASAVAGLLGLWLLLRLARRLGDSAAGALWGLAAYAGSRWVLFPATSARPDMLCTLLGYLAIVLFLAWRRSGRRRELIAAGVSLGLGGLAHPFALVYAIQLAVWGAIVSRGRDRLVTPLLLAGAAALTAAVGWLPLIAAYPDAFRVQFSNQFLHDKGGGLLVRLAVPWESLNYHGTFMWDHIGPIQMLLPAAGLVFALCDARRRRNGAAAMVALLAVSSVYLMCALVGPHHHVIGYWSYTAGLMFLCLGRAMEWLCGWLSARLRVPAALAAAGVALGLGAALLPGSGLRATAAYIRHWNDMHYDAPRFARALIDSLPPQSVYAVDTQFALDFLVHNRNTLLAQTRPIYFRIDQYPYDALIISRYGLGDGLLDRVGGEFIRSVGVREDEFACYAEVYSRRAPPSPSPGNSARPETLAP